MSILLSKKDILVVNAKLAAIIGLNDAIVLQQLAYWLEETSAGIEHDGVRWIYNTHPQWLEQFPFWSIETVKRAFASLQKRGLIIVKQLAASTRNQTNHYTIDYAGVDLLHEVKLTSCIGSTCATPSGQFDPSHQVKLTPSTVKTETTTETTTEILPGAPSAPPENVESAAGQASVAAKPCAGRPVKTARLVSADGAQDTALQAACKATWATYSSEYATQYGAAPIRNAKVNANVKAFVQRIGHDEAPGVAAFFVSRVNDAFVVRKMHDFSLLLASAESYRTQWATGQAMTNTRAQQADKTQSNFDAAQGAKALLRARREQRNAE